MTKVNQMHRKFQFAVWVVGLSLGVCAQSFAATTDLATQPISTSSTTTVRPNLLFTLDDSGSMAWGYLPDYAGNTPGFGGNLNHCKSSTSCMTGMVPYQTGAFNGLAYNPSITYQPPVNANGSLKTSWGSPWSSVPKDGFGVQSAAVTNLTNGYPEVLYCNGGTCKKNGVDTNNPFLLRPTISDNPPMYALPGTVPSATTVASNVYNGLLNKPNYTSYSIISGTLNEPIYGYGNKVLSGTTLTRQGSTTTILVTYTNPPSPPLATGDTVVVSGGTCSSAFKSGGGARGIIVINATSFTYTSSTGSNWSGPSCTVSATKATTAPSSAPSIAKSGTTVTVTLSVTPTPALATGNLVTVANGSGTCDAAYQVSSAIMTRISSNQFTYTASTAAPAQGNNSCNITQVSGAPPVTPGISLHGTLVTVYKTTHGLVTGNLIQVVNGTTGTCDNGYQTTSGGAAVTVLDANTFTYSQPVGSATANSNCKIDKMNGTDVSYTTATTVNANPYYFVIIPTEYCDSLYLTNCIASTAPTGTYTYAAPVRFCVDAATAALPPGNLGAQGAANCQAKMSFGTVNFQYVRYGLFWRGDIVPARTTYGKETYNGKINVEGTVLDYSSGGTTNVVVVDRSARTDCAAAPNCTYAEEMTNFANWYAYYQTRMQMMKTSAGRAFAPLNDRYRVGFVTINESSSRYLPINVFKDDASTSYYQRTNWYAKFYAVNPGNSTPLREALSDAGRYFAGKKPGIFSDDPMEYACQQDFELITTDGYWNGTDSNVKEMDGTTQMRDYDNVNSGFSKRKDGAYDGGLGASDTLADVAMYYYKTDLRNSSLSNCTGALGSDVCADEVPMTADDTGAGLTGQQHMTTYSLGLADGLMAYQSNYKTATTGDFANIKTATTGCAFSGGGNNVCNWPVPVADTQTALDDLWHAAVNGRGTYYNARDPGSVSAGLSAALAGISVQTASASASATSTAVITQTDRSIFSSTYRTTVWDGEVTARLIDPATGDVLPTVVWTAQAQLDALTPRFIYTYDDTNALGNHVKEFQYANLTASEKAYFDNKCAFATLSQCTPAMLTPAQIASGNLGSNLVNYLHGDRSLEIPPVYRTREHLLGDTVNAKPLYIRLPQYSFTDTVVPSYTAFKTAQGTRQGALYMGANDGMLHAFNTDTGAEMWAYVPKIVMPNMYKLADTNYATNHQYYVDGSPVTLDIFVDAAVYPGAGLTTGWHTLLVGGLGLGGRGFYALDVTDPSNPVVLWEMCSDSTRCANFDVDMGYSYGNPVITKRSSDGKWVVLVTSGYNNVSPGSGKGILYELDAVTGALLNKVDTGTATDPPSGLAKISPWVDSIGTNFTTRYVYGADLNGDLWRFDLGAVGSAGIPTVTRIASLKDGLGVAQSVTTRVELGDPMNDVSNSLNGTGNPVVFVGTGRLLGNTDKSNPVNSQIQTIYAIEDDLSKTGAAAYIGNPRSPNGGFHSFVRQYLYQPNATSRTVSANAVDWTNNGGWYVDLQANDSSNVPLVPNPSPGERVRLDFALTSGTLFVASNVPTGSACSIGGSSWLYSFSYRNGQNLPNNNAGMYMSQGAEGTVIVDVAGSLKGITTQTGGGTTTNTIPTPGSAPTKQTSWRELE